MDARKQADAYEKVQALGIIPDGQYQDYRSLFTEIVHGISQLKQNIFNEVKNANGVIGLKYLLHSRFKEDDTQFPFRIDIYEKAIRGKGGFGAVHRIVGKVKLNQQLEISYKPIYNAALKLKSKSETYQETENEDNILKCLPHLKMTAHTIVLGTEIPVIRMRYFSGSNLATLINEGVVAQLRTTEKLIWAVGILKTLNEQYHRNGIIHRDLSLGNILIDATDTANPIINIVDTDTCVFESKKDKQQLGTYEYRAPEGFMPGGVLTKQSDHYSIMLCIMAILTGNPPYVTPAKDCAESERHRRSVGHAMICDKCNRNDWFMNFMKDIQNRLDSQITSCEAKDDILSYFMTIIASPENNRPSLSHSITFIEEILLKHQLRYVEQNHHDDFKEAYATGVLARTQVQQTDNPIILIQIILSELATLPDHPLYVNEFTQTLGIPLLRRLAQNATDLTDFLYDELEFYEMSKDVWYESQIPLTSETKKLLDKLSERHERFQQIAATAHWTLDLVHELNNKNRVTFVELMHCTPSIRFKQILDDLFDGRDWQSMDVIELNKTLFAWLANENKTENPEQLRAFVAHYQLLFAFKKLKVNVSLMELASHIPTGSIQAFIDGANTVKFQITRLANSKNVNLFSQSATLLYRNMIDTTVDNLKVTPGLTIKANSF